MGIKEREEKFIMLAEKRVQKALRAIRLVKNLSNRSNYSYTDRDAAKITRALLHEVQNVRVAFRDGGKESTEEFKLR